MSIGNSIGFGITLFVFLIVITVRFVNFWRSRSYLIEGDPKWP